MEIIQREGDKLAAQCDGEVVFDEELLNEVAPLVENPIPIIGEFCQNKLLTHSSPLLTELK